MGLPQLFPRSLPSLKLGSFNVRGIMSRVKREALAKDMARYELDIVALQETKVQKNEEFFLAKNKFIFLESDSRHYGNGFVISARLAPNIEGYQRITDRIAVLTVRLTKSINLKLVNVYGPTSQRTKDGDNNEADEMYNDLNHVIDKFRPTDLFFVVGDFNSKMGRAREGEKFIGSYGRGKRNLNGHALASALDNLDLFAVNTAFKKPARNITTWVGDRNKIQIYNQIDYILCAQDKKYLCTDAQSWGGTYTNSDHKLVTATFDLSSMTKFLYKLRNKTDNVRKQYDTAKFAEPGFKEQFAKLLDEKLKTDVDSDWTDITESIKDTAESVIGFRDIRPQKLTVNSDVIGLVEEQKNLRQLITTGRFPEEQIKTLKKKRNDVMHRIRRQCRLVAQKKIIQQVEAIENTKDSSFKMYQAIKLSLRQPKTKLILKDVETGEICKDAEKCGKKIISHFQGQFFNAERISKFNCIQKPLERPILAEEFRKAFSRMTNGKAAGIDNIPAELLKYSGKMLSELTARLFNDVFGKGKSPDLIGKGLLVALPKGKASGECANLRPICLLTTMRKSYSLVILARIQEKVEKFLGNYQSGFRKYRGTMDAVWAHRFICARSLHYQRISYVLGIDFSKAFDTIDRGKLIEILKTFLNDDEVRMISILLADTSLQLKFEDTEFEPFDTNIGVPQGDSLSPILFTIYLEYVLRELAKKLAMPHDLLQRTIAYADDCDFRSDDLNTIERILELAPEVFAEWSLKMNVAKTELTVIEKKTKRFEEYWRNVKKLGSLMGDVEDVSRRKQLAMTALNRMWKIWNNKVSINEKLRIRIYNVYVSPVLLHNCGTWGLTTSAMKGLESFHRRQLRRVLGIHYPARISCDEVYKRTNSLPLRFALLRTRWKCLGHILRRPIDIPANAAMIEYFDTLDKKWKGRDTICLPRVLHQDLGSIGLQLKTNDDLSYLRDLAQDRAAWRSLSQKIWNKLMENYLVEKEQERAKVAKIKSTCAEARVLRSYAKRE